MLFLFSTLPFVCLLGLILVIRLRSGGTFAESALVGGIVWSTVAFLLTESLSVVESLVQGYLLIAWLVFGCLLMVAGVRGVSTTSSSKKAWRTEVGHLLGSGPFVQRGMVVVAFGLMTSLLLIALWVAPNNHDGLAYHLPKVMHWLQNGHVGHYPTHIPRQVYLSPMAEYLILQPMALGGHDYFVNCIQWLAFAGGGAAVWELTRCLGGGRFAQVVALFTYACLPMAILQATTSQNDLVVSFYLLCFIVFGFRAASHQNRFPLVMEAALAGFALGFAILTKSTAYLFALPFVLYLIIAAWRMLPTKTLMQCALVAIFCGLAINAANYVRLYQTYGSPMGTSIEPADAYFPAAPYGLDVEGVDTILSSLVKNASLHTLFPWSDPVAREGQVRLLHRPFHESPDRRGTNLSLKHGYQLSDYRWNDANFAGQPFHVLLLIGVLAIALWRRRGNEESQEGVRRAVGVLAMSGAGFLLFCTFINWQPVASRLHLPLFAVACAPVGLLFARQWEARAQALWFVVLVVFTAQALPLVVYNNKHQMVGVGENDLPFFDRTYYLQNSQVYEAYEGIRTKLNRAGCQTVGLVSGRDEAEYLLWVPHLSGESDFRLEHVNVQNETRLHEGRMAPFQPCAIIHLALHGAQTFRLQWLPAQISK